MRTVISAAEIVESFDTGDFNPGQLAIWNKYVAKAALDYIETVDYSEWSAIELIEAMSISHRAASQALNDSIEQLAESVCFL